MCLLLLVFVFKFYRMFCYRNISARLASDNWSTRSPRSATGDEGRPRWGDRGVATGRLWEPTAPNARLPQVTLKSLFPL